MKRTFLLKTMLLLCALIVGSSSVWADEVTFTPGTDTGATSVTKSGVTCTMTTMNNASYYQIYASSSGTFSMTSGNITKIEFTCTASGTDKYGPGNASADGGTYTYSESTGTWTGNASSVTISSTAQIRMTSLTITYTPAAPAYTINAQSNNNDYGTVSLSGSVITGSPKSGCRYATPAYSISPANSATVVQNGDEFTVTPSANTTVTINFEAIPTHKAAFYVNGTKLSETDVQEGDDIVFPSDPDAIGGKEFVGWIKSTIDGNTDIAPAQFFTSETMDDADINFYAVFATLISNTPESWSETVLTSMTSTDIFVITATNSEGTFAMTNDNGTSDPPAADKITIAEGKITSATIADEWKWNVTGNATDGYTFYPNGSTTTWLYCNTTAGSSSNNNIRVGTGTRKVWKLNESNYLVTDDTYTARYLSMYNQQDFRGYVNTSNGAFVPVFYKYVAPSKNYEGYCTTITEPITISASKYNTYASTSVLNFSGTGVTPYKAAVSGDNVVLTAIDGGIVPANTGVIVYSESAGTFNIPVTTTDATVTGNEMVGVTTVTAVPWEAGGSKYNYILQKKEGESEVKFYKATGANLKANRAYLSTTYNVSGAGARGLNLVFADDMTTSLREMRNEEGEMRNVYNLNGQRVSQPTKGLYIVNGKKYVVK